MHTDRAGATAVAPGPASWRLLAAVLRSCVAAKPPRAGCRLRVQASDQAGQPPRGLCAELTPCAAWGCRWCWNGTASTLPCLAWQAGACTSSACRRVVPPHAVYMPVGCMRPWLHAHRRAAGHATLRVLRLSQAEGGLTPTAPTAASLSRQPSLCVHARRPLPMRPCLPVFCRPPAPRSTRMQTACSPSRAPSSAARSQLLEHPAGSSTPAASSGAAG